MIGPCPHTGPLVYLGEQKQLEGEPTLHLWNCECGSTVVGPSDRFIAGGPLAERMSARITKLAPPVTSLRMWSLLQ